MFKHDGFGMPVPGFIKVRVKTRAGKYHTGRAMTFNWLEHANESYDIVEYELVDNSEDLSMIPHDGKKMPVYSDCWVRVLYYNGETEENLAQFIAWEWDDSSFSNYDVIAYEVFKTS